MLHCFKRQLAAEIRDDDSTELDCSILLSTYEDCQVSSQIEVGDMQYGMVLLLKLSTRVREKKEGPNSYRSS